MKAVSTPYEPEKAPAEVSGLLALSEPELIEFYTRAQLQRFGGDKKKAAGAMGVTVCTIYNRMRRWGPDE